MQRWTGERHGTSSLLAGVSTVVWALYLLPLSGVFGQVTTTTVNAPQVVHAPAGWVAPHQLWRRPQRLILSTGLDLSVI